uniref:Galectin n=1 Tax=Caenorhabditis tropicalis TaxID=1561998 RepID=A0A1I7T3U6_9PELO
MPFGIQINPKYYESNTVLVFEGVLPSEADTYQDLYFCLHHEGNMVQYRVPQNAHHYIIEENHPARIRFVSRPFAMRTGVYIGALRVRDTIFGEIQTVCVIN